MISQKWLARQTQTQGKGSIPVIFFSRKLTQLYLKGSCYCSIQLVENEVNAASNLGRISISMMNLLQTTCGTSGLSQHLTHCKIRSATITDIRCYQKLICIDSKSMQVSSEKPRESCVLSETRGISPLQIVCWSSLMHKAFSLESLEFRWKRTTIPKLEQAH